MRSKLFAGIFALVFLLTSVSAIAKLEIETIPNQQMFITEVDAYSGSSNTPVASPFSTFTGDEGKLVLDYTPEKSIFKLGLLLKDESGMRTLGYYVFDGEDELMHDGKLIKITFLRDEKSVEESEITKEEIAQKEIVEVAEINETEILENESVTEEVKEIIDDAQEISEENNEAGFMKGILIHGNAILQENKSIVNVIAYVFGGIILVVPLLFFFKRRLAKKGSLLKMKNSSDENDEDNNEDEFAKAEEDLKKARDRLDALKGKKLEDAKKKLLEDERELMRLRNLGR